LRQRRDVTTLSPRAAHTFTVAAVDAAGNVDTTPATRTWQINITPPDNDDHEARLRA